MKDFKVGCKVYYKKENEYHGDEGVLVDYKPYNHTKHWQVKWIKGNHVIGGIYWYSRDYITFTNPKKGENMKEYKMLRSWDIHDLIDEGACKSEISKYINIIGYKQISSSNFADFMSTATNYPSWIEWLITHTYIEEVETERYFPGDCISIRMKFKNDICVGMIVRKQGYSDRYRLVNLMNGNVFNDRYVGIRDHKYFTTGDIHYLAEEREFTKLGRMTKVDYETT
jgi:hypothetical protein